MKEFFQVEYDLKMGYLWVEKLSMYQVVAEFKYFLAMSQL